MNLIERGAQSAHHRLVRKGRIFEIQDMNSRELGPSPSLSPILGRICNAGAGIIERFVQPSTTREYVRRELDDEFRMIYERPSSSK